MYVCMSPVQNILGEVVISGKCYRTYETFDRKRIFRGFEKDCFNIRLHYSAILI